MQLSEHTTTDVPAVNPAGMSGRQPAVPRRVYLLGAGLLASLPVIYFNNPNTTHVPLCPFHSLTGLNCPLCGGTRAVYALMHGEWVTAIRDNAWFTLGLPFILFLLWRWVENSRTGQPKPLMNRTLALVLLAVIVAFGVVRNLPFGAWLSPPT